MTAPKESAIKDGVLRSSVQMVMLTAPDPAAAARFYVEQLGFRIATDSPEESIVEGLGMQVVLTRGARGRFDRPPGPDSAIEIPCTMQRIEAVWESDQARFRDLAGPMLDASGTFVYVTLDPANNALALVAPLPSDRDEAPIERVTQRIKRPDF